MAVSNIAPQLEVYYNKVDQVIYSIDMRKILSIVLVIILGLVIYFVATGNNSSAQANTFVGSWGQQLPDGSLFNVNLWEEGDQLMGSFCYASLSQFDCPMIDGEWQSDHKNIQGQITGKSTAEIFARSTRSETNNPIAQIELTFEDRDTLNWNFLQIHTAGNGDHAIPANVRLLRQ